MHYILINISFVSLKPKANPNPIQNVMKTLLFHCLILLSAVTQAQFNGGYAPAKWTISKTPGSNGSMDVSAAPASIMLSGSDSIDGNNEDLDFVITVTSAGNWGFSWSYRTYDDHPVFDEAGVLVNGVFTVLTNASSSVGQSGNYLGGFVNAGTVIGFRVRATNNIGGYASFTISNFSAPQMLLPVKLKLFKATERNAGVYLIWQTLMEENASHFEVERSYNGVDFKILATVGMGGANGTYSFMDHHPSAGNNYYRLKIVDKDGGFSYSENVKAKIGAVTDVKLFPNPVIQDLLLKVQSSAEQKEVLTILDGTGRVVSSEAIWLREGMNHIHVPMAIFKSGVYVIKLQEAQKSMTIIKN